MGAGGIATGLALLQCARHKNKHVAIVGGYAFGGFILGYGVTQIILLKTNQKQQEGFMDITGPMYAVAGAGVVGLAAVLSLFLKK